MNISECIEKFSLDFSIRALKTLKENENLCISTSSIYLCLIMLHIASKKDTAAQLTNLLGKDYSILLKQGQDRDMLIDAIKKLLGDCSKSCDINNKIFSFCELKQNYVEILRGVLNAEAESMPFQSCEKACDWINSWIREKTKGRIPRLLTESSISSETVFVLVNTIYFKSPWLSKYDSKFTKLRPFYMDTNNTIETSMMTKTIVTCFYCDRVKKYSALVDRFTTLGIIGIYILPDNDSNLRELVSDFTVNIFL
uniref:Corticosteroid-binding globulin (Trinotate prediction) n=1 Tax=Henneguya salminicola TaxID=69463 RepID=A0A6G3MHG8_HENSL